MPDLLHDTEFDNVAKSFGRNIHAMRVFFHRFGGAASDYDREALDAFTSVMSTIFPDDLFPSDGGEQWGADAGEPTKRTPAEEERLREAVRKPGNLAKLIEAATALGKAAPKQESILLESTLVTLMSHLEALVADLIHAYYTRYPAALPADDRALSLTDLRELGSIEEAERFLVSKEVDSILRESLDAQLEYLSKKFKLDLSTLDPYRDRLAEIAQRRNLYVHNRGVVNRTYLKRVKESLVTEFAAESGVPLRIEPSYVDGSLDIVEITGTILIQQAWRKWDREKIGEADSVLVNVIFEGLQTERYNLVTSLAGFASNVEYAEDISSRMVCINHAIALRDTGQPAEVERVLGSHDWSSCSLKFQLALDAVRGEENGFYEKLPRAIAAEEVSRKELLSWPLFRNFRETERFTKTVSELFRVRE